MGKNGVDGVYSADPRKDKNAKKFVTLNYQRALVDGLAVMDASALSMARDNKQKIRVFGLEVKETSLEHWLVRNRNFSFGC